MLSTLRSAWAWAASTLLILAWIPIMGVVSLFDRDPGRYRTGRWFRRLGSAMVAANASWTVVISGSYPSDPRNPYVVVANHQSMADIPFISRLPWDMKWVGKAELFRVPVIGWMMRISRDLPVDRKDRRSRAEVMVHARERLEHRVSVMIFPEGTRTRDGRVNRFNDGAFRLAVATGTPVLPIAIDGTFDALPKGGWRFGPPLTIRIHVFEPVPVEGLSHDDARDLQEGIRTAIIGKVAEWRGVDPADVDGTAKVGGD